MPAGQEDERDDREDDEQVDAVLAFERHARDRHRDEADEQQ